MGWGCPVSPEKEETGAENVGSMVGLWRSVSVSHTYRINQLCGFASIEKQEMRGCVALNKRQRPKRTKIAYTEEFLDSLLCRQGSAVRIPSTFDLDRVAARRSRYMPSIMPFHP